MTPQHFLILNRLLRQDLSIHVDDILSVVLACQIYGYWFQDQLFKQLVVQLCSTTAPLTYNCQGRSVIQVFFSSAIAYSGEQTELSVGTSNYEPKYRNLHRLQKDLRQSCMSENYTTTTFYISHFSTIYCQQLDQLLFTAVFPIWREWGISKSPTHRLTADCSASELHSHFGGGGRICTYDQKLMGLDSKLLDEPAILNCMVRKVGLEPTRYSISLDFKSNAFADFATLANKQSFS